MSIIGNVSLTATDVAAFSNSLDRLMELADSAVEHGGRYLAKGGTIEATQGEPPPDRILVLEFEHVGQARSWMRSAEYAQFTDLASTCCQVRSMIVEGA